ncbi:DeoR/GlpR family DNA-binding transcription regulator [Sinomonas susongensis]|uniref:DeoR/GlpR family DNA-binding transcription regulator n=1 Tax=Sinomonas susongensis TaxID=1324851 RepID=UPI001107C9E7|nr:DeoR/GlpR family DNA-binding transcription regulator [Sinomonas susongensis]
MNAAERRSRIAASLELRPATVDELAGEFDVSLSTIRRDLDRLAGSGRILRTYGGAAPASPKREQSLRERELTASEAKEAIGRQAASLVAPGSVNILDAGTTVGALARCLTAREDVTVVTNGMTTARALEHADGVEVVLLGGRLRHISSGTVGPLAEAALAALTADAAFLGADGVSARRGLSEETDQQASLKRAMVQAAEQLYVLADATKLEASAGHWWTPIERPWTLITDASASEDQLRPFRDNPHVTLLVVESGA